jgi:hypothetical protein
MNKRIKKKIAQLAETNSKAVTRRMHVVTFRKYKNCIHKLCGDEDSGPDCMHCDYVGYVSLGHYRFTGHRSWHKRMLRTIEPITEL